MAGEELRHVIVIATISTDVFPEAAHPPPITVVLLSLPLLASASICIRTLSALKTFERRFKPGIC